MRIERLNKKKEVLFEEHSKGYVIIKQKIINKSRLLYSRYFIYTSDNCIL